jgi:hypothetical protein
MFRDPVLVHAHINNGENKIKQENKYIRMETKLRLKLLNYVLDGHM